VWPAELADEENQLGNKEGQRKPIRAARHHVLQQEMPLPDL